MPAARIVSASSKALGANGITSKTHGANVGSGAAARKPADGCRVPLDPWGRGGVVQRPLRDLVLARPPHVLAFTQPSQDPVEHAHPRGAAGDPLVQSEHHQAPAVRALLVELLELVDQLLLVVGGREARVVEAGAGVG